MRSIEFRLKQLRFRDEGYVTDESGTSWNVFRRNGRRYVMAYYGIDVNISYREAMAILKTSLALSMQAIDKMILIHHQPISETSKELLLDLPIICIQMDNLDRLSRV